MTQSRCVICSGPITSETDSQEHIIQNAIGGRRRVLGFIHRNCNSTTGNTWDAELARQLAHQCLLFGIVRERGISPPFKVHTTAGEHLMLLPGGGLALADPRYAETQTPEGKRFVSFSARDMNEARRILKGIQAKYPKVDAETLLAQAEVTSSYPQGAIQMNVEVGGELAGRSVVKTAVAFAHSRGIDVEACDLACRYLREAGANPCFGHYYTTDLVQHRPAGLPFHCVAVSGDPQTGMLLSYVEYFGSTRIVACLSETYQGSVVKSCYAVDPLSGKELNLNIHLDFSTGDIEAIYTYEHIPPDKHREAYEAVFAPALQRQDEREKDRVIAEAVAYAFANCGAKEGEELTEDQAQRLAALMTHRMQPFIERHLNRSRLR